MFEHPINYSLQMVKAVADLEMHKSYKLDRNLKFQVP